MQRVFRAAFGAVCFLATAQLSSAAIMVDINPSPLTITQGTNSAAFDIVVAPTAGDAFNSFTLSFGVGDGGLAAGAGADDGDNLPISGFSLGSMFGGTDFSANISAGGLGQSAIQIAFTRAGGNTATLPANGILASFTLDTTGTTAGQAFVLNPNLGGNSAAFDGNAAPIALSPSNGFLQVVAVPEPSSLGVLACFAGIALRRRRSA